MPWSVSIENNKSEFDVSFGDTESSIKTDFAQDTELSSTFGESEKQFDISFVESEYEFLTNFGEITNLGGGTGGGESGGGDCNCNFTTDETLSYKNGVLSVNRANEPDPDNTLPITAAAVATTVGNIEILLQTI